MTKDEALKFALEALEGADMIDCDMRDAITAIKEALAQPEHGWTSERIAGMSRLKEAQDKKAAQPEQEPDGVALTNISHPTGAPAPDDLNADALEVVELELPDEDEAVGWADGGVINWIAGKQFKHASYLYATPPQRTWVGLTEDDKVLIKHDANFNQFMTAGEYADRVQQLTEARLKDLNT